MAGKSKPAARPANVVSADPVVETPAVVDGKPSEEVASVAAMPVNTEVVQADQENQADQEDQENTTDNTTVPTEDQPTDPASDPDPVIIFPLKGGFDDTTLPLIDRIAMATTLDQLNSLVADPNLIAQLMPIMGSHWLPKQQEITARIEAERERKHQAELAAAKSRKSKSKDASAEPSKAEQYETAIKAVFKTVSIDPDWSQDVSQMTQLRHTFTLLSAFPTLKDRFLDKDLAVAIHTSIKEDTIANEDDLTTAIRSIYKVITADKTSLWKALCSAKVLCQPKSFYKSGTKEFKVDNLDLANFTDKDGNELATNRLNALAQAWLGYVVEDAIVDELSKEERVQNVNGSAAGWQYAKKIDGVYTTYKGKKTEIYGVAIHKDTLATPADPVA